MCQVRVRVVVKVCQLELVVVLADVSSVSVGRVRHVCCRSFHPLCVCVCVRVCVSVAIAG